MNSLQSKDSASESINELGNFLQLMRGKSFEAIVDPQKYISQLEVALTSSSNKKKPKKISN